MYSSEWNIINRVNLPHYHEEEKLLNKTVEHIISLKEKLNDFSKKKNIVFFLKPSDIAAENATDCLITEFKNMLLDIQSFNHKWVPNSVESLKYHREKRLFSSIIDGNTVSKTSSGINSFVFDKFFGKVNTKQINQEVLLQFHTTFIETFLLEFNNSTTLFSKKVENVNNLIDMMEADIKKYYSEVELYFLSSDKLSQLRKKYRFLLDALILTFQRFFASQKLYIH